MGSYSLKADEGQGSDQEFLGKLNIIKDPFEEGFPVPVVVAPKPVYQEPKKPVLIQAPKPKPPAPPVITLPSLKLQGVVVGEDIHEAIINDRVVPLRGTIKGARVVSVTKKGVGLLYKHKKFFLNVE